MGILPRSEIGFRVRSDARGISRAQRYDYSGGEAADYAKGNDFMERECAGRSGKGFSLRIYYRRNFCGRSFPVQRHHIDLRAATEAEGEPVAAHAGGDEHLYE